MVFDKSNRLYTATYWNEDFSHNASSPIGFYIFDGNKWAAKKLDRNPSAWEEYGNLSISPDGKYIAFQNEQNHSYTMGVRLFEVSNGSFNEIKPFPDGVPMIESVAFDNESKLWMLGNGSVYKGSFPNVFIWGSGKLEVKKLPLMPTSVTNFSFMDNDEMKLSSGSIFYGYNTTSLMRKTLYGGIDFKAFDQTNIVGQTYLMSTYKKLMLIQANGELKSIPNTPEINKIYKSILTKEGTYLLATDSGICIYKNNEWQEFNTSNSNLKGNKITAFAKDAQGNIWVAGIEINSTKAFIAKFDIL
jgi:hypothetical protein